MFHKIQYLDYRNTIIQYNQKFTAAEQDLLAEILTRFEFDPMQEQALVQAVLQQSRFDPNVGHFDTSEDDEDTTGVCPHCINPPAPPLRDYLMWREQNAY
ncbi:hypothetical protein ACKLNO_03720 [Neisseriaceae bacterium B1]